MERTLRASYRNEFLKYAALNVLGMLGLSCYILADTFFISRGMGANGLTALNLAIPVYSFIHGSGLMLGMGGAIKYAIFRSQGRTEKTDGVFSVTVRAGVLAAVVFLLLGVFGSGALTGLLGADAEVFDMTNTYLRQHQKSDSRDRLCLSRSRYCYRALQRFGADDKAPAYRPGHCKIPG